MLLSGVWIMQEVEEIDSEAARRKSHLELGERGGGELEAKFVSHEGLRQGWANVF